MFCREQAASYNERLGDFRKAGVRVVAIGNGNASMARDFVEKYEIEFDVYTDPRRESYKAMGLKKGGKIGMGLLKASVRALTSGHLQGLVKGDAKQLGGVLVVGADKEVLFSHSDDFAGDHADIDEVLRSVKT